MQQSHEALDRPGGFSRVHLFAPLAHRDYRLLAGGMSVSLLGDGVFLVALAWQVYTMSDAPTALATVGIAMTIPTIACLLIGGAVSDRFDRRLVMLIADAVRAVILAALAALAITGALAFSELLAIAVVYGAATAFFNPASDALVPQLLPADKLAQANSLDQLIRPL
ncbi:MAG: MFS transporter, partial [Solirubrobacteraceae bacterium]